MDIITEKNKVLKRNTEKHKKDDYDLDDKKKSSDPDVLPEKFFSSRNSLLTDMLQNLHFRVIYRLGLSLIFAIILSNGFTYYIYGSLNIGLNLYAGFNKFHHAFFIWCVLFLSTMLSYIGFRTWEIGRNEIAVKGDLRKMYDAFFLSGIVIYYFGLILYIPANLVVTLDLPPLSSVVVILEQLRLLMKIHAFLRTNIPKITNVNRTDQPTFKQFIYFLFAPTLVYQNNYPRTEKISWKFVFTCLTEVCGCTFMLGVILEKFMVQLNNVCLERVTILDVAETIVSNALYGTAIAFLFNYLLLHSWQNAFAEMLRFSDRLFYKDWWTSTSYQRHYRTWNVVVHDWLYTYIYKDFYEIILPKNKTAAKITVTLFSALFHEYFIAISLRFFLPVLFFQFFILGTVMSLFKESKRGLSNVFLLYTFGLGLSWQISIYTLEYLSKIRNNEYNENIFQLTLPSFVRYQCVY